MEGHSSTADTERATSLRRLFDAIDADGSGVVASELAAALRAEKHADYDVRAMMATVDKTEDGRISWEEFSAAFGYLSGPVTMSSLLDEWHSLGEHTSVGCDLSCATARAPPGLPPWRCALAGSAAAISARFVTAPLEKVTLMMQVSGQSGIAAPAQAWHAVWRAEGLAGLWAGAGANCLRVGLFGGVACLTYCQSLKRTPADDEYDSMEPVWRCMCGTFAGLVATMLTHPLDVVRTRLTLQDSRGPGAYHGALQATRRIVSNQGWRGLWLGLMPACLSVAPFVGLQLTAYDTSKQLLLGRLVCEPSAPLFIGCGAFAGVFSLSVMHPLDTVRRRMQATPVTGAPPPPAKIAQALHTMIRDGGPRALWAGIWPAYLRVAPAMATSLLVRDTLLGRLRS
mmetsp:Transcript_55457/g.161967  ORF Transcript_55457/g.161967 Transcript_55457/m.161967 type:complete len:398 (+) Transcript_55457:71-1264(+)